MELIGQLVTGEGGGGAAAGPPSRETAGRAKAYSSRPEAGAELEELRQDKGGGGETA